GVNGLLFPPGDAAALAAAVARCAADGAFASRARRENIALVAERGMWRDNMARVEEAFSALAARGGGL
ncbi:MAG: glycosyltransferase family 1 protein, partial [Candidatus Krumholzibacteria bacterium]|nr:glycosyltransferase family 1 protein [Candidatus Krumholzibacteria bacterium]